MSWNSKVVLITGGSSGIGEAAATKFVLAGAQVIICGRSEDRGKKALSRIDPTGMGARFIQADMGDRHAIDLLFNIIEMEYGDLAVAINNAALPLDFLPFNQWSDEEYDRQMQVGLKGVWRCMVKEVEMMRRGGRGAVVNVAALHGTQGLAYASLYSAIKHGVIGFTRSAAKEYARSGIRINAVGAGVTDTPRAETGFKITERYYGPGQRERILESIPMGRMASADEIAEGIFWLASDKSSYVTGTTLMIDGGASA